MFCRSRITVLPATIGAAACLAAAHAALAGGGSVVLTRYECQRFVGGDPKPRPNSECKHDCTVDSCGDNNDLCTGMGSQGAQCGKERDPAETDFVWKCVKLCDVQCTVGDFQMNAVDWNQCECDQMDGTTCELPDPTGSGKCHGAVECKNSPREDPECE